MNRRSFLNTTGALFAATLLLLGVAGSAKAQTDQFHGAIFTTTIDGKTVNGNVYDDCEDVYLNGGPQNNNSAGLPDGKYYFQVTNPSGSELLSLDDAVDRQLIVKGGRVFGVHDENNLPVGTHKEGIANEDNTSLPVRLWPFSETPNNGGVYKVALIRQTGRTSISPTDPKIIIFDNRDAKFDNFKCIHGDEPVTATITAKKYYDADVSASETPNDSPICGWRVELWEQVPGAEAILADFGYTGHDGLYKFEGVEIGKSYVVKEIMPDGTWVAMTPAVVAVNGGNVVVGNETYAVTFGNVQLGAGGGLTPGFWSNPNGQKIYEGNTNNNLAMIALNLRNKITQTNPVDLNGLNFDPLGYVGSSKKDKQVDYFRTWLINGTAENMAYMLSVQLSAMKLNVLNNPVMVGGIRVGGVSGTALIYAPGALSATNGFTTVNALIAEANTELGSNGLVQSDSPFRGYQELLKNALDSGNNNLNFVQPAPADCILPY